MKPSSPVLLFVESFLITVSISLLVISLFIFPISSWISLQRLYISRSLSTSICLPGGSDGKESVCNSGDLVGKVPWRRKWESTPVFLPGKSHKQRSLAGYRTWLRVTLSVSFPVISLFRFSISSWYSLWRLDISRSLSTSCRLSNLLLYNYL